MKNVFLVVGVIILCLTLLSGCVNLDPKDKDKPIVFVWYPNASTKDLETARLALGKVVEEATGRKVKHTLTTDYAILIEALANNRADLCLAGMQTYIEAHDKNPAIKPLVIPSGPSGTLDDAMYYSWLAVSDDDSNIYANDEGYTLDNIVGKRISFVSSSSTSGFKIPTNKILRHLSSQDRWTDLEIEDLMEGGANKPFDEVIFSGSHQVSAVNLITEKADIAAFADIIFNNYGILVSGEENTPGAIYQVKTNAAEPFNSLEGETFTLIACLPVPSDHIIMNTNNISDEEQAKLIELFTSRAVSNNSEIFMPKESNTSGFLVKTDKECFLPANDKWYEYIKALSE